MLPSIEHKKWLPTSNTITVRQNENGLCVDQDTVGLSWHRKKAVHHLNAGLSVVNCFTNCCFKKQGLPTCSFFLFFLQVFHWPFCLLLPVDGHITDNCWTNLIAIATYVIVSTILRLIQICSMQLLYLYIDDILSIETRNRHMIYHWYQLIAFKKSENELWFGHFFITHMPCRKISFLVATVQHTQNEKDVHKT